MPLHKETSIQENEIVLYQPNDAIHLEVRMANESVWLTQTQIAVLFGVQRSAITKLLRNIFKSGELEESSVSSILEHTATDGKTYMFVLTTDELMDLRYIFTVIWKLPEKDLLIIKHDFEVIVDKIKRGKAHLLSEGDTEYLTACRKGNKSVKLPSSTNVQRICQETLPPCTNRTLTNPLNLRTCFSRSRTLSNGLYARFHLTNGHIGVLCRHHGVNLRASALS